MPAYTAPALFIGLGARVILDLLTRSDEPPTLRNILLFGLWAGVSLQYAYNSPFLLPACVGVGAKIFLEFLYTHNVSNFLASILGLVLGFTCTDFLASAIDGGQYSCMSSLLKMCVSYTTTSSRPSMEHRSRKRPHTIARSGGAIVQTRSSSSYLLPSAPRPQRQRAVSFRPSAHGDTTQETQGVPLPPLLQQPISDITSVDSNSDLIGPNPSMSLLEREIAALRARASLADTERRRYKEERKWAESQGNMARASQMKWQVKRYTNLMQSFHNEADAKLIEGALFAPILVASLVDGEFWD